MANGNWFKVQNENGEDCSGLYQHLPNLLRALLDRANQNKGHTFTVVEGNVPVAEFKVLIPPMRVREGDVYLCKHAGLQPVYRKVIEVNKQKQKVKWVMCEPQGAILTHSTVYEVPENAVLNNQLVKEG